VEVELVGEDGGLRAEVRDDGAGFDPLDRRSRARRMGLNGMRERAAAIGAELDIRSRPGEGTRVVLRLADG
jgi:signal transduction histidine kinase